MPDQILSGSNKHVWWHCDNGHAFRASPNARTRPRGYDCGYCANRVVLAGFNDLATTYPELAATWHPTLNGELTPADLTAGHNGRVWWTCQRGHAYRTSPNKRTSRGAGCGYCSHKLVLAGFNDLATLSPGIASEWDRIANGSLTPNQVTAKSERRTAWICSAGHSYISSPADRQRGLKCPYCSHRRLLIGYNDFATTHPEITSEWHPTKNTVPATNTLISHHKRWWLCAQGHEQFTEGVNRIASGGCTLCPPPARIASTST